MIVGSRAAEVTALTVYGVGQLFFRTTDGVWHLWASFQANPSAGPTASPVPVGVTMSPSRPNISHTLPLGSYVADVGVTVSDGSSFSGALSLDDTSNYTISGSAIVTNALR